MCTRFVFREGKFLVCNVRVRIICTTECFLYAPLWIAKTITKTSSSKDVFRLLYGTEYTRRARARLVDVVGHVKEDYVIVFVREGKNRAYVRTYARAG